MKKSVGFLTFNQMRSESTAGSSRIRAESVIKYWPEAELFRLGHTYSAVIFQKAYWLEFAAGFKGAKILDLCDPDYLHWNSAVKAMADQCDAITTSTERLASFMRQYTTTPAFCIPDRIDFEEIANNRKSHCGNGPTSKVAWYGYSSNFKALDEAVYVLPSCGIKELIVIATKGSPYKLPKQLRALIKVTNYAWDASRVYEQLLQADLVLNFDLSTGRWKYKSNNKTTLAWALGLPVAHSEVELRSLMTEQERMVDSERRQKHVRREYDVRDSVKQYKTILTGIMRKHPSVLSQKYDCIVW